MREKDAAVTCEEARRGLWPPERPRLCGDEVLRARRHVDECAACADFFRQDRAILDSFHRLRSDEAPREIREAVFDALARERAAARTVAAGSGLRRATWGAWGLVAILAVALAVEPSATTSPAAGGTPFVDDYLRRAVAQENISTSDPGEVARFLARELGLALRPLDGEGLQVEGAEVCLLDGRLGAMVLYRHAGRSIAHYMIPRPGVAPRPPAPDPSLGDAVEGMPTVVTWSSPGIEEALVGDVGLDVLVSLAGSGRGA